MADTRTILLETKNSYLNLLQVIEEENKSKKMGLTVFHAQVEKKQISRVLQDYFKMLKVFEIISNWITDEMEEQRKKEQIVSFDKIDISCALNDNLVDLDNYFTKSVTDILYIEWGYADVYCMGCFVVFNISSEDYKNFIYKNGKIQHTCKLFSNDQMIINNVYINRHLSIDCICNQCNNHENDLDLVYNQADDQYESSLKIEIEMDDKDNNNNDFVDDICDEIDELYYYSDRKHKKRV